MSYLYNQFKPPKNCCCSVSKLCPTLLQPHELQDARLPCPSLSPRVCSNSCPLSQWYHLILWCPHLLLTSIFPSIRFLFFFPTSQFSASGGQSIGALASAPPVNIQGWFPLGLTSFDLLGVQGTSQVSSPALQFESIISSALSLLYGPIFTSVHDYWKNHSFDCMDLCRQSGVSAF